MKAAVTLINFHKCYALHVGGAVASWLVRSSPDRAVPVPALGARFTKAPETFRARKAIFSSSVSKNREVYPPETACMKKTSVLI